MNYFKIYLINSIFVIIRTDATAKSSKAFTAFVVDKVKREREREIWERDMAEREI